MSGIFRNLVRHLWRSACKSPCVCLSDTQVWEWEAWFQPREGGLRSSHLSLVSGDFSSSALSLDHSTAFIAAGIETWGKGVLL